MSAPPDSTLANPEQRIADLERQLAERDAALAERAAERDEALAREVAVAEVLGVINALPGDLERDPVRLKHIRHWRGNWRIPVG